MRFHKYQGLGNDFVLLDARPGARDYQAQTDGAPLDVRAAHIGNPPWPNADLARRLCDRRLGVGADGVLWILEGPKMVVLNADGSRPEACGNGLRCVALYLHEHDAGAPTELTIGTDAGPRRCEVLPDGGGVRAEMGVASFPEVPGLGADVAVDVGNPHRVCFVGENDARLVAREGAILTNDPAFEDGCNVGFARLLSATATDTGADTDAEEPAINLAVFERGVGPTQACGSGACAAAAAAVRRKLLPESRPIRVDQPGGSLLIEVGPASPADGARQVTMTGPATRVFTGELP